MGKVELLQPIWQIKKLVICNVIAILLFSLWAWPLTRDLGMQIDTAFFKTINHSLSYNHMWATMWAIMSVRYFDLLVAVILLLFLIKPNWLYNAIFVRQAFFALVVLMLLQVVIRVIFTKCIQIIGWQHASPSMVIEGSYRLSEHFSHWQPMFEIKDSSNRSFPGDHASVLMIWALFLSVFAYRFSQYFLIWVVTLIFMMPRLMAGAHWASDDYIGGFILALLALGWGVFTPFAAKLSHRLVTLTLPIFHLLKKIPLVNKFAIVRYPE